ncbi:alpha/beta fold hydrolase [Rubrivirga sp. IMCC43871]|uniref:alpha/beta fold hydrolase n=1 Tax=Rubrivirga sp. IMCC43871 TaxID=3391575 RepID=UPI00398F95CB
MLIRLAAFALVFALAGCAPLKRSAVAAGVAALRADAGLDLREATVDGRTVAYLERPGDGPALVLLHGFGANKDAWLRLADALPEGRRLLAPDLSGHGDSPAAIGPYDTERYATEVAAWLDAVAPGPVDIAGNSMGGAVAARLALAGRVRRLIVMDPAGITGPEPSGLDSLLARGEVGLIPTTRAEYDRFVDLTFARDPDIPGPARDVLAADNAAREPFLRGLFQNLGTETDALRARLGEISIPALVIWGAEDRVLSPSAAPIWAEGLPDARLHLLPGVGHAPMMEAPGETASLVADFLR